MNHLTLVSQRHFKLDWKTRLLDRIVSLSKPLEQMSWEELRQASESSIPPLLQRILAGKQIALAKVVQQDIRGRHGNIPLQLYYPFSDPPFPLILFFHGGGWVYGNLQTHDPMCRRIAQDTGAIVLAVGYRLAPFFKYPTALEDCYDAYLWAVENTTTLKANPEKVIVMGDSAGGNLATALSLMDRDLGHQLITQQILLYPVTSGKLDQPSIDQNAYAPVLTKSMMQCFVAHYARGQADIRESYFSPLLAQDLSHLPPALIVTCEYDPLHDQAQMYAQRLQEAATPVELVDYSGTVHAFMSFPVFCQQAATAFEKVANYINSQ